MGKRLTIILVGVLVGTGTVFADGGMFFRRAVPRYADVYQPTQKVYIRWDGSEEKLLIQTKYEGPAEEMVWIVPVPAQPTVERADGGVFNDLSKRTYDPAIDFTDFVGLDLSGRTWSAGGSASTSSPVEWHERIGDYDVALLRPVGGEDVIQWLNANDFATPEAIHPIIEDYIANGWWMVASRIHPDALSSITSEKLAKGTLHPLLMTFPSPACVYPMRLTSMAAGPVEELIYIEGPAHYEPATLTDALWDIKLYGGPVREVLTEYPLSDMENAVATLEGRTRVETKPRLTKLRRVFQPSEMTDDIVFREIDLAQWLSMESIPFTPSDTWLDGQLDGTARPRSFPQFANTAPIQIAQAATQYGRWRDPNGIAALVGALSPGALDQVKPEPQDYLTWPDPSARFLAWAATDKWSPSATEPDWAQRPGCGHLRSCIWALGEIGVEREIGETAKKKLIECAQHDNQLIRMEAYLALTKVRNQELGPILTDRLACILRTDPLPALWTFNFIAVQAEMDIMAEWVICCGTTEQKDTFVAVLRNFIAGIDGSPLYFGGPEASAVPLVWGWREWTVWRAASIQDERLIPALESLRSRLSSDRTYEAPFVLTAEAACGSAEATANLVRQLLDDEATVLGDGQIPGTGDFTSLDTYYYARGDHDTLRVQILWRRGLAYVLFPMPAQTADLTIRSALADPEISDLYALYLLAGIRNPQPSDKDRLMRIWNSRDGERQLLAVDVLYVWGDEQMLMDLYAEAEFAQVKSEIAWALAALKIVAGGSIIEEQVRESWNPDWLVLGSTFIHENAGDLSRRSSFHTLPTEIRRHEQDLWSYFHPAFGVLDDERLAVLKRLAADGTIHAGMRFDLLGRDYGGTAWGLPLLEQAARDILAVDSSAETVKRIRSMMTAVGNAGFLASLGLD